MFSLTELPPQEPQPSVKDGANLKGVIADGLKHFRHKNDVHAGYNEIEKEELIEILSKPTLSKRVVPKNEEEQEEDKTIAKPQVDIPNSFKQLRQNIAYSANVTKDRLLLPNNYNIPEINIYKEFILEI